MKNKKIIILLLILVILFPVSMIIVSRGSRELENNMVDYYVKNTTETEENNTNEVPMLNFSLENLQGEVINSQDYIGKPMVVNFWATWCPPCREEAPAMERMEDKYTDMNFFFINVMASDGEEKNSSDGESKENTLKFLEDNELELNNVLVDAYGKVSIEYGIPGYPTTFFINSKGNIVSAFSGALSEDALEEQLQKLQ
ncbi:MAG: TlpA family protein disulfide reductase [Lachnospirales bacterium]